MANPPTAPAVASSGLASLFDAGRHTKADTAWDAACAQKCVDTIVQSLIAGFDEQTLWQIHPLDRSPERADALKTLYYGAAGVMWTLDRLGVDLPPRMHAALDRLLITSREDGARLNPAYGDSYLMGEAGLQLLRLKLGFPGAAEHLATTINNNTGSGTIGIAWGSPGTTLAALFAFEMTGDRLMLNWYQDGARRLWESREEGTGTWQTSLYGHDDHLLGGLHGFAANASVLVRGLHHLDAEIQSGLEGAIARVLSGCALTHNNLVNWPLTFGDSTRSGAPVRLVQHCNGAPGVINCLAPLMNDHTIRNLLLGAGELVWAAGPPTKLPSLCHGTAGNGYAFLKLFEQTGDTLWLERARAFAMTAISQSENGVRTHGQHKYSLWTGDAGLALFVQSCLMGDARFPTLDYF